MERISDPAGAAHHGGDPLEPRVTPAARSRPPLGALSLLALGVNGVVGVGIFFAPREVAAAQPGAGGLLVYVAVALLLLPVGLVYARLGRAMTADGGPYLYARSAFGPTVAFAVGFTTYVSALFSSSAVLVGLVEQAMTSAGPISRGESLSIELALLALLMFALSRGLRLSAAVWTAVTAAKILPLLALPLAALFVEIDSRTMASPSVNAALPGGLLAAALPVLFALQGFEVVPLPAGEVHNAERNVPLATVGALLLAALLYVAIHAACLHALPDLSAHTSPLAEAAGVYGGPGFSRLFIVATSLSALGIVIGMLAMTPRYLAPLGHPDALGFRLDEQNTRAIPLRAFRVTFVLLATILIANTAFGSLAELLVLSSVSVVTQYAVTAAALWTLAGRRTAGLSSLDGWPAPLALLSCALLCYGASTREVPIFAALLVLGFAARALGRMRRTERA